MKKSIKIPLISVGLIIVLSGVLLSSVDVIDQSEYSTEPSQELKQDLVNLQVEEEKFKVLKGEYFPIDFCVNPKTKKINMIEKGSIDIKTGMFTSKEGQNILFEMDKPKCVWAVPKYCEDGKAGYHVNIYIDQNDGDLNGWIYFDSCTEQQGDGAKYSVLNYAK